MPEESESKTHLALEASNRFAHLANLPKAPDLGLDWPAIEGELQRANQLFWDHLQNQMNRALAPLFELHQQARAHSEIFRQLAEQQAKLFQIGAASALSEAIETASRLAYIDWEAVARDYADGPRELALRGWFITLDSPAYYHSHFLELIRAGRVEECEHKLEKHYEEELPEIRDKLLHQFPERKSFLEEAFKLHDEGRYISAIPLFLIQSDGIGKSIFGTLPLSKNNLERLKQWVDTRVKGGSLLEGFWRCIHEILPITAHTEKLGAYPDPLNRHAVLHGSDVTYGTRRNSLKAIAWLQYVASFASLDKRAVSNDPAKPSSRSRTLADATP